MAQRILAFLAARRGGESALCASAKTAGGDRDILHTV